MENEHQMYILMNQKLKHTTIALILGTSFVVDSQVQAKTIQAIFLLS